MSLLDDLNPGQREAATATEPVVVVAGAGTGKTRVITYRVAWLISEGVAPQAILAVTFTNKAASEMKQRIRALVPESAGVPWVGTFHSFCARLLRTDGPLIDIPRDFAIYDDDDQIGVVRQSLRLLGYDERRYTPRSMREIISHAKNNGWDSERLRRESFGEQGRVAASLFDVYNAALRRAGALDFDDLLLEAVRLLQTSEEARKRWRARFAHIVVDEFQDVNEKQYELVRLLAGPGSCVAVVGDEDQSIYSWRGADPGILRRFLEDFPGARVIRVETNYRSTQTILDAAAAVVSNNPNRMGKHLTATRTGDSLLSLCEAPDASAEAEFVVGEIRRLLRDDPALHVAVLYRTNFQSRSFEEACRRSGLVFRVVGGFGFYERAEVKDLLAYARVVVNPADDAALARVINTPPRGLGKTSLDALRKDAAQRAVPLWDAMADGLGAVSSRAASGVRAFRQMIEEFREKRAQMGAGDLIRELASRTGYLDWLEQQDREELTDRAGNVKELVAAAEEGQERGETLEEFLDRAALVSDADSFDEHVPVTLITLHSAKGLEFDHAFLVGMEEGLFPHVRSLASPPALEEERRLCYVGMTRARQTLTLTRARSRRSYDRRSEMTTTPSRFLAEIPKDLMKTVNIGLGFDSPRFRFSGSEPGVRRRPEETEFSDEPPRPSSRLGDSAQSLVGQRVRHPTFGIGTVLSVEDEGDDRRLTVSFPDHGMRKLIERYARLERV